MKKYGAPSVKKAFAILSAISSSKEGMGVSDLAKKLNFPFPYLFDDSQKVAKAYQAACTPDFNLFDADGKCVYRGQLDGARPGNEIPVTGVDLRAAIDVIINNQSIDPNQKPSIGCGIKWKK